MTKIGGTAEVMMQVWSRPMGRVSEPAFLQNIISYAYISAGTVRSIFAINISHFVCKTLPTSILESPTQRRFIYI